MRPTRQYKAHSSLFLFETIIIDDQDTTQFLSIDPLPFGWRFFYPRRFSFTWTHTHRDSIPFHETAEVSKLDLLLYNNTPPTPNNSRTPQTRVSISCCQMCCNISKTTHSLFWQTNAHNRRPSRWHSMNQTSACCLTLWLTKLARLCALHCLRSTKPSILAVFCWQLVGIITSTGQFQTYSRATATTYVKLFTACWEIGICLEASTTFASKDSSDDGFGLNNRNG